MTLTPFAGRVALYGSLDITLDQQGLAHGRQLLTITQAAVQRLEGEKGLPAAMPSCRPSSTR